MPNEENLKGHGFHERTAKEQREIAIMGGKASGEARRRKADFRKTLNLLLTAEIEYEVKAAYSAALFLHNSSRVTSSASASLIAVSTLQRSNRSISSIVLNGTPESSDKARPDKPFSVRIFFRFMIIPPKFWQCIAKH